LLSFSSFAWEHKIINKNFSFYVRIYFPGEESNIRKLQVKINQLAAFFTNTQSIKENLYIKTSPTSVGGIYTDSVYGAFKYILETNDNIPSGNINYGNLEEQRGDGSDWTVGRYIDTRKSSQSYLKELCEHSYVALYPNRKGERTFNAWLDKLDEGTADWLHDNNVIIKNTLSDVKKLPIKDVYNDFVVQYNWNQGKQIFDNQIYVTKTDESTFPAYSGNWQSYVGGYNNYPNAQVMWENAASGYLLTNTVVSNPKNLQDLVWFNTEDTAYNYLDRLIRWTSTQHMQVEYSIPLTEENINIELTDKVFFNDKLLTNNSNYTGYVDGITYNTKQNIINISLMLQNEQYDPQEIITIVETGSADIQIHESGNLPDTIVET
jgi:hypothetical protein